MENFVENVLKYGSIGEFVDIGFVRGVEGEWVLFIIDYGEGIVFEYLLCLIECFYWVDVEFSCVMKGMGLGFVIVKYILIWY